MSGNGGNGPERMMYSECIFYRHTKLGESGKHGDACGDYFEYKIIHYNHYNSHLRALRALALLAPPPLLEVRAQTLYNKHVKRMNR